MGAEYSIKNRGYKVNRKLEKKSSHKQAELEGTTQELRYVTGKQKEKNKKKQRKSIICKQDEVDEPTWSLEPIYECIGVRKERDGVSILGGSEYRETGLERIYDDPAVDERYLIYSIPAPLRGLPCTSDSGTGSIGQQSVDPVCPEESLSSVSSDTRSYDAAVSISRFNSNKDGAEQSIRVTERRGSEEKSCLKKDHEDVTNHNIATTIKSSMQAINNNLPHQSSVGAYGNGTSNGSSTISKTDRMSSIEEDLDFELLDKEFNPNGRKLRPVAEAAYHCSAMNFKSCITDKVRHERFRFVRSEEELTQLVDEAKEAAMDILNRQCVYPSDRQGIIPYCIYFEHKLAGLVEGWREVLKTQFAIAVEKRQLQQLKNEVEQLREENSLLRSTIISDDYLVPADIEAPPTS